MSNAEDKKLVERLVKAMDILAEDIDLVSTDLENLEGNPSPELLRDVHYIGVKAGQVYDRCLDFGDRHDPDGTAIKGVRR